MIVGQLLKRAACEAVHPRVADMKNMRDRGLDNDGAQCANVALVLVIRVSASPGLRIKPGICRGHYPVHRRLYRPGFGGAVIIHQKAFDGRLACYMAYVAAADAIRQYNGDAFETEQRLARNQGAVEVLIGLLMTFIGMLPYRYLQFARHA